MNRELIRQNGSDELMEVFWSAYEVGDPSEVYSITRRDLRDASEIELENLKKVLETDSSDRGTDEYAQFLRLFGSRIRNSRSTLAEFVKAKFIPEHVAAKSSSGRTHYHAILKHILSPITVDALFGDDVASGKKRLIAVPDWPYLDNVRLCDLTTEHVQKITSKALAQGYSVQTVKHIRSVIGTVISHATKCQYFSGENPALQVAIPRMIRKRTETMDVTQAAKILGVMKYPEKEIALLAVFTGLKLQEICGLQWKHVNLTNSPIKSVDGFIQPKTIAVRYQWSSGELCRVSDRRVRDVQVREPLLSMLRLQSQRTRYAQPDDFVLVSRTGSPIGAANIRQNRLKRLGRTYGMPWLSWHTFIQAHKILLPELSSVLTRSQGNAYGEFTRFGSCKNNITFAPQGFTE